MCPVKPDNMVNSDFDRSFEEHLSILDEIDDNLKLTRQRLVKDLIIRLEKREEEWNDTFRDILSRSRENQGGEQFDINNQFKSFEKSRITGPTHSFAPKPLDNAFSSNIQPKPLNAKLPTISESPSGLSKPSESNDAISKSSGIDDVPEHRTVIETTDPKKNLLRAWRKTNKEFTHPSFSNYFAIREFVRVQEILIQGRDGCKDFNSKDPDIRSYKTELMMYIRLQINSISGTNPEHLRMKIKNLSDLFNGLPVKSQNRAIDVNNHPVARAYCIDFAAQTCVVAGVRSNINVVKDLGAAINSLDERFPGFKDLVIGHVQERCPFTIPMYPDPDDFTKDDNNNSVDDRYKIACGYQTDPRSKNLETDQKYLERMRFMILFYASVMNGGRIELCWSWLASFLSLFPEPVITATVLEAYLSVVSKRMQSSFGCQYEKMLAFVSTKFVAMIEEVTSEDVQSLVKLKNLLTEESKIKHQMPVTLNSIFGSSALNY